MRAFLFPGQGSQSVGMGKALADASAVAREVFQEVDEALGLSLYKLMTEGPEDQLTLTENAQPAIMANAIATLRVAEKEGGIRLAEKADFVAGHSLGEYTALTATGALGFDDGVRLVCERADAMHVAGTSNPGTMSAILGLDDELVEVACRRADSDVWVANFNAPGQIVIAGSPDGVAKAIEIGDGARVPELLRQRDRALADAAHINRVKESVGNTATPRNDTVVNMKARQWAAENPWFNPSSNDPDSAIAKTVDASLVSEGFDPSTDRYWDELDRRVSKYLPHHFTDDAEDGYTGPQKSGRRSPPVGGSRGTTPGKTQVYLSTERVNALKDAGAWDDPVKRDNMLRRFAEWDRNNKAAR